MKKLYYINILIRNDLGEILDKQYVFSTMDEMNRFLTDPTNMHKMWCEAQDYAKENLMYYEELFDSKEEAERAVEIDSYDGGVGEPVSEEVASTPI